MFDVAPIVCNLTDKLIPNTKTISTFIRLLPKRNTTRVLNKSITNQDLPQPWHLIIICHLEIAVILYSWSQTVWFYWNILEIRIEDRYLHESHSCLLRRWFIDTAVASKRHSKNLLDDTNTSWAVMVAKSQPRTCLNSLHLGGSGRDPRLSFGPQLTSAFLVRSWHAHFAFCSFLTLIPHSLHNPSYPSPTITLPCKKPLYTFSLSFIQHMHHHSQHKAKYAATSATIWPKAFSRNLVRLTDSSTSLNQPRCRVIPLAVSS